MNCFPNLYSPYFPTQSEIPVSLLMKSYLTKCQFSETFSSFFKLPLRHSKFFLTPIFCVNFYYSTHHTALTQFVFMSVISSLRVGIMSSLLFSLVQRLAENWCSTMSSDWNSYYESFWSVEIVPQVLFISHAKDIQGIYACGQNFGNMRHLNSQTEMWGVSSPKGLG